MAYNGEEARKKLQDFNFKDLFIEVLGWSRPASPRPVSITAAAVVYEYRQIAQLAGVAVLQVTAGDGRIPDAQSREAVHKQIAQTYHENLLIFLDGNDHAGNYTQSLWYWVKRDAGKLYPRHHLYVKGQPGDLLIGKLSAMFFDLSELDQYGKVPVIKAADNLRKALDVSWVTKRFFTDFQKVHEDLLPLIGGIDDERDRRWYASVLLNRLMFIYFLQRKGFLDRGKYDYLLDKLAASKECGTDLYYSRFLRALFFEGFAKPAYQRSAEANALLGEICYLNGGLFLPHPIELRNPRIAIPDRAFDILFALFRAYTWNLDDTPGGQDGELNPDVLGYIFEKYINQKAFGAYYTRTEITEYLCERTIHTLILERVNTPAIPGVHRGHHFESVSDLLINLDAPLCRLLIHQILPNLTLLDPACGSGAFLVAAMKTLIAVYSAVIGRIEFLGDPDLRAWLEKIHTAHPSVSYYIKKRIISDNLFGVDLMEEGTEIARLRLFLALVSSATRIEDLEPLPNSDFNILPGNSLVGLLRVDATYFDQQRSLFHGEYQKAVQEKNRKISVYRDTVATINDPQALQTLRDDIQRLRDDAAPTLDQMLLDDFTKLGAKFEGATWDGSQNQAGKSIKRVLTPGDMQAMRPFHWGYEFDQLMNERGGFDAILTNPPWEIFKPQAKEFFVERSELVTKKKMRIEDFEEEQARLLLDPEIRAAWLEYLNRFPHLSQFFRSAPQYEHQISRVNGKKVGTDINLYKLFLEQCFNLLRPGGQCGIVIPSGIYTDLGAKELRELLFVRTRITGLFGFENRKAIFEGVDSRFKFVVLTFAKGGHTEMFDAAFMRHEVEELERFPQQGALPISVDLVCRLSPDSLSIMEFKSELDVRIDEKALQFPLLGEKIRGTWNLTLSAEFHMTNDGRYLFERSPAPGRLPLHEGKMIHQFSHLWGEPRYWVDETRGRKALIGRGSDQGQMLDYQRYRIGFRDIASNTNERTLIATVLPHRVFAGNTLNLCGSLSGIDLLLVVALLNSFANDFIIRQKVTAHCNMFYVYQLPVPRLSKKDAQFCPIVERAARLTCTTPEFDDLAKEVGLRDNRDGVTEPLQRARLRAELDGLIAHVYSLTETEFAHVLGAFPLVADPVKVAAQNAYRDVERGLIQ